MSQDRAGGRSPAEQEAEARAVCVREGWDVADVVTDSVGASRHSKGKRDGWARARELVSAGAVDVLVTWEASRAQRDLAAYTELRDLCARSGVRWSYSGRTYDLTAKDDRFQTGLDALLAEREADEIAERVQRAMRANAAAGRPHGRRLFGYQRLYDPDSGALAGQMPHDTEADVVRGIFASYLSGKGIRTIAADLNAEGVTTGTGSKWNDAQVRRVLTNPAYVSLRVHRGEIVGRGEWPSLVDVDTFERAGARLRANSASGTRQTKRARLLTGVGRCGVCGGRLSVGHDRKHRKVYQCRTAFCVARDMARLDEWVGALVVERLSRPDAAAAMDDDPADVERAANARRVVDDLRAQIDDAIEQFTDGKLTAATLAKIEARLLPKIDAAEKAARQMSPPPIDLDVPENDVAGWWDGLDDETRRSVVGALLAAVVVVPIGQGRRSFDQSEGVRIEWRRSPR